MSFISNPAVLAQREAVPRMYGAIDFSKAPERWAGHASDRSALHERLHHADTRRQHLLANTHVVGLLRDHTMMGDPLADAYAALIPQHGLRKLMSWLETACAQGLEAVPDAPPELHAFIRHMAQLPAWLNWDLIEEGGRATWPEMAYLAPIMIRGSFLATFNNTYAALPMALTGTLSHSTSAHRVFETAYFFTVTSLPGELRRRGRGFKAAAMVRLMHSMVRFHAMSKPGQWDASVYGVPIPQVDQMPAGLIGSVLMARKVLKEGRSSFTRAEQARLELARYRCYLLGLPEVLLPEQPQALVDILETRAATLRSAWDDATCGALTRSTMEADLGRSPGWYGALQARLEPPTSRLFFVRNFVNGDEARAAHMGVPLQPGDKPRAALGLAITLLPMLAMRVAQRLPVLRTWSDRKLVRHLEALLVRYGHANFTSDASQYRPSHAAAQSSTASSVNSTSSP